MFEGKFETTRRFVVTRRRRWATVARGGGGRREGGGAGEEEERVWVYRVGGRGEVRRRCGRAREPLLHLSSGDVT